jgi:hypothetical protein
MRPISGDSFWRREKRYEKVKQYCGGLLASVHETAEGLTGAGVMSKQKMREFDELA